MKSERVQLQARSNGSKHISFTMDDQAESELISLKEAILKNLNINASVSVIMRRAISLYLLFLTGELLSAMNKAHEDKEGGLRQMSDFLERERKQLFISAGRKQQND